MDIKRLDTRGEEFRALQEVRDATDREFFEIIKASLPSIKETNERVEQRDLSPEVHIPWLFKIKPAPGSKVRFGSGYDAYNVLMEGRFCIPDRDGVFSLSSRHDDHMFGDIWIDDEGWVFFQNTIYDAFLRPIETCCCQR